MSACAYCGMTGPCDSDCDGAIAYERGKAEERAAVVAYIKRISWNDVQDWNGDQFEGDYNDIAKVIRECIKKGEHEVKR